MVWHQCVARRARTAPRWEALDPGAVLRAHAVIIPQAPFGMPKFDNGERWDLKAKCVRAVAHAGAVCTRR